MFVRRLLNITSPRLLRYYSSGVNGSSATLKTEQKTEEREAKIVQIHTSSRSELGKGDNGKTSILTGEILDKDHNIFHAIGATEELLSFLGLSREYAVDSEHDYIHKLKRIQTVIIDISTAISRCGEKELKKFPPTYTKELEEWIEKYSKDLPPPELYIIPGGGVASAALHVARSLCRRTERVVIPLVRDGGLDKETLVYLNRLADFLFILSRVAAKLDNRTESIYIPQPDQKLQPQ